MNVISTKQYAKRIWHRNTLLFKNAAWLSGSTLINSGLGFVYWWLAARLFPPAAVGLGSAIVSAMMLLGIVGMLGLGTLLIGELPRRRAEAKSLLSTALLTSGGAAAILGLLFTYTTPWFSSELSVLAQTPFNTALFVLGVVLSGSPGFRCVVTPVVPEEARCGKSHERMSGIVKSARIVTLRNSCEIGHVQEPKHSERTNP